MVLSVSLLSCTNSNQNSQSVQGQVVVNESTPSIGENLNLKALGELCKTCKTPQEIEQRLNVDNTINNLDLDGDGNRDYLKVTEFGQGNEHGFSITDCQKDGEPEVATININTQTNSIVLNGNPQYYGNNNMYQSNFSVTDFILLSWILQPHYSYYHSPYRYGYYGYGYRPMPIIPYSSYHLSPYLTSVRSRTTYRTVTTTTTHIKSPNSTNVSKSVNNRVSNPTQSRKSFDVRNNNKPIGTGGFNSRPSSTSPSSSSKSSSSSSSSPSSSSKPSSSSSPSRSNYSSSSRSWGGSSGSSGRSSGSFGGSSGGRRCDIRSKENIVPLNLNINDFDNIRTYKFNYKPSWCISENLSTTSQYGYMAQELEKTFPNVVTTDTNGFKMVDYYQMTAVNTEMIKSLITTVELQNKEILELKKQIKK